MSVTVVAILCYLASSQAPGAPELCHEEIVHRGAGMDECLNSQAALADWKEKGRFASPEWRIAQVKCMPGSYEKRDEL